MSELTASDQRWVTATALLALAGRGLGKGDEFTGVQFAEWVHQLQPNQRTNASTRLCHLGFVKHSVQVRTIDGHDQRVDVYTVTPEGAAAIEAAGSGHVRKSGPKTTRAPNPLRPTSLVARLWNLMRIKRALDSDYAAELLCDAGGDFRQVQASVRKYLRRWSTTGAVKEAARRVGASGHSNGVKRYVLVQDSPTPPAWRDLVRAKGASK